MTGPGHCVQVRFIEEVSRRYPDNPYHSWKHAVDVANTIFTLLHLGRPWVEMHLTRLDVFCLMVAAISHDVGHRGVSNGHLCKTDDILALTYNNRSVQEMMHAASLFQLTANIPEANVFEALPPSQLTEARSTIIDLILDTDMAQHFHRIGELEVLADTSLDEATGTFRQFTRDEVKQVMNAFLHIADLGHAFKPPRLHALWSARVLQEFFAEAEIQKELGIPPLPFMDPDKCFVPVAQMEYLDFVVRPYTAVLVRMLPSLKLLVEGIRDNYLFWLEAVRRSHRAVGIRASIDDAHARFATPGEAASGAGDSTKTSGDRDGEIAQRAPSRLGKMPGAPPRWGAEKGDAAEEEDSLEDVRQWVSQLGMKTLPMTAREIKVSATRTTFMGKLEPLLAMEMPRASQ